MAYYKWKCSRCGTTDRNKKYKGGWHLCKDCTRWDNAVSNSKRSRKEYTIAMTEQEFLDWLDGQEKFCHYCGITEECYEKVGLKSFFGKESQILGVDRIDSERDYEEGNIVMCCLMCNRWKSDVFTYEEAMLDVGPTNRRLYLRRLGYPEDRIRESETRFIEQQKEKIAHNKHLKGAK